MPALSPKLDQVRAFGAHVARTPPRRVAVAPAVTAWGLYRIRLGRPGRFMFAGRSLTYLHHAYGKAYLTERTVEIPIAQDVLRAHPRARTLEVGNCLSHFGARGHDVVDRYERAPGVINEDVVAFRPQAPYELIISVSTLEHVGWDEEPRDPARSLQAFANLRRCLAPGGLLVFTVPIGYNPEIDRILGAGELPLAELRFLRRVSRVTNRWREAAWHEVRDVAYGRPYRAANAVAVGTIRAP